MGKTGDSLDPSFRLMRQYLIDLAERDKERHYQKAVKKAVEIAGLLKSKYGVEQVYLYGSLAWGGFTLDSDIDLFLVGAVKDYWQALCEAEKIAAPIKVSLACERDCFDSLKIKVFDKGVLL